MGHTASTAFQRECSACLGDDALPVQTRHTSDAHGFPTHDSFDDDPLELLLAPPQHTDRRSSGGGDCDPGPCLDRRSLLSRQRTKDRLAARLSPIFARDLVDNWRDPYNPMHIAPLSPERGQHDGWEIGLADEDHEDKDKDEQEEEGAAPPKIRRAPRRSRHEARKAAAQARLLPGSRVRARRDNPCQEVTGGKDQWRTVAQQEDEAEVLAVYGDGSVDVRFEDGEKIIGLPRSFVKPSLSSSWDGGGLKIHKPRARKHPDKLETLASDASAHGCHLVLGYHPKG